MICGNFANNSLLGPMPSPSGSVIKLVIQGTPWLAPDTSVPLIINSIPPYTTVQIRGTLKAFIRHEGCARDPGTQLYAKDVVKLLAYSERLRRAVPDFCDGANILIQYPVRLLPPNFLDCMTKADKMTASWVVSLNLE